MSPPSPSPPNAQTVIDMFELGWFGQGTAFWRWIETDAARPHISACAALRRAPPRPAPQPGDLFDAFADNAETHAIDDPARLTALVATIEVEYGDPDPMDSRP